MSRDSKEYTWTWKNTEERLATPVSTTKDTYKIGLQQDMNFEYELQENGTWLRVFKACEVEVKYAGWEANQHHPMHKRKK